jgi:activator of HSP90 ATPase
MEIKFEVSVRIHASALQIYDAWLDSVEHSAMTGGKAEVSAELGGEFKAWDGYITGTNLVLEPGKRIVQSWCTDEFEVFEENSNLEILLEQDRGQTLITIRHTKLPAHGMQYKQGWVDAYFKPMGEYFGS